MRLGCSKAVVQDWSPADKPDLVRYANNRTVWRNFALLPHPYTDADADAWLATLGDRLMSASLNIGFAKSAEDDLLDVSWYSSQQVSEVGERLVGAVLERVEQLAMVRFGEARVR